jgi:1,2-phenylacetyl-CoA epoxidase catalytic subunit
VTTNPLNVGALDETAAGALRRLILTLADSKRMMGIRYSDWLLGAPSIETGIAASSMAQDEWGHARLLYAMLKDLGIDPVPVEHDRPAEAYASVGALDEPMPDWAALIAAMVVVDGALTSVLASFAEGSYQAARNRVPKMIAEEEFHASLGAAWFNRLAGSEEARGLLVRATEELLPPTLAWVGADDEAARTLVDAAVIGPAEERLAAYHREVSEILSVAGVDIATVEPSPSWDATRGRTSGCPDEDAVERARGDKNRALLVE